MGIIRVDTMSLEYGSKNFKRVWCVFDSRDIQEY